MWSIGNHAERGEEGQHDSAEDGQVDQSKSIRKRGCRVLCEALVEAGPDDEETMQGAELTMREALQGEGTVR